MANQVVHRHSGYTRYEGLYRVPDLLNEEQFVKYMKNTYNVTVKFVHEEEQGDSDSSTQLELEFPEDDLDLTDPDSMTDKETS